MNDWKEAPRYISERKLMSLPKLGSAKRTSLEELIHHPAPDWLTPEIYKRDIVARVSSGFNRNHPWHEPQAFLETISRLIGGVWSPVDFKYNPRWSCFTWEGSVKFLVNLQAKKRILSTPLTGQDPKEVSGPTRSMAGEHAARHFGLRWELDTTGKPFPVQSSEWIEYGTFNVCRVDGHICLEPLNVEHRLWGLIGFPQDVVQLINPVDRSNSILLYHEDLPEAIHSISLMGDDGRLKNVQSSVKAIDISYHTLTDCVNHLNHHGIDMSKDEFLDRYFYSNKFNLRFTPEYTYAQAAAFFTEVNTSDQKSKESMLHASSDEAITRIKKVSSPKFVEYSPTELNYHPLFEMWSDKSKRKLKPFMFGVFSWLLFKLSKDGTGNISHSDSKIKTTYLENSINGIDLHTTSDEEWNNYLDWLDNLYSYLRYLDGPPTHHQFQILNWLINYLENDGFVVFDKETFIHTWSSWMWDEWHDDDGETKLIADTGEKFGTAVLSYGENHVKVIKQYVKQYFLKGLVNTKELCDMGIVKASPNLVRCYSRDDRLRNLRFHNMKDIDGKIITVDYSQAGHIISHYELIRMTPAQRDEAFKKEGLGDTFEFAKNMRAMSTYHNLRMGILRLSEYVPYMHSSRESELSALIKARKAELKQLPVLTL
jgi:hypothetical protein